jgi:hypothetical protein
MCIPSKVFYETMINDARFSLLSVVIWRPSSQRKKEREKKKFCVLWPRERDNFFSKARKDF